MFAILLCSECSSLTYSSRGAGLKAENLFLRHQPRIAPVLTMIGHFQGRSISGGTEREVVVMDQAAGPKKISRKKFEL
jgi:hypothetical protein